MQGDGNAEGVLVSTADSCYFDLAAGFSNEWRAMEGSFVVADLEVLGPDPENDQILEFAAIRVSRLGEIQSEFSRICAVTQSIPAYISDATGISSNLVGRLGEPTSTVYSDFYQFAGGCPIFIHHAEFDLPFLYAAARLVNTKFDKTVYDTADIFFMCWPEVGLCGVDRIAAHLGIERTGPRAVDDAKVVLKVLLMARELARCSP